MAREFNDLASFAVHLATVHLAVHIAEQRGLEKVGVLLEKDAKAQIGQYQEAHGPFSAWEELADSTEAEKSRLGYATDAPLERTGELRDSIEHEVAPGELVMGSKSDKAEWQEFGTDKIPPRPFIGPAAFKNKEKIQRILGAALVEGLVGGEVIHHSLGYDIEVD